MATMIEVPRGLAGVAVTDTSVGDVRGEEGFYHYRQYDACELARERSLEDVWRLMIDKSLPDSITAEAFRWEVAALRVMPEVVHPVVEAVAGTGEPDAELRAVMAAIGGARGLRPIVDLSPDERRADALAVAASMPTAVAALHRRRHGLARLDPDPT